MQKIIKRSLQKPFQIFGVLTLLAIIALAISIATNLNEIKAYFQYGKWEARQIQILDYSTKSGNGLAPLPEANPEYERLVASGTHVRPLLVAKLKRLRNRAYSDKTMDRRLSRYVAYAIIDVSGWSLSEVEQECEQHHESLEDAVSARLDARRPIVIPSNSSSARKPKREWKLDND